MTLVIRILRAALSLKALNITIMIMSLKIIFITALSKTTLVIMKLIKATLIITIKNCQVSPCKSDLSVTKWISND
jgi:hypothetical protein